MADPRVEAVARILVDYSVNIQPGEFVGIDGVLFAKDGKFTI